MMLRKKSLGVALLCVTAVLASACGSEGIQISKSSPYHSGAVAFLDHCSGCHTISVVGAEGSATNVKDRLYTNGPNFNYRKVTVADVLYAIRNGGFSGAIMPQNIVLGQEAVEVAKFLAEYSGSKAEHQPTVNIKLSTK